MVLAVVCACATPSPAAGDTFEELYREALEARAAGDFKTAILRLEKAVALQPENVDALLLLGALYGFERRLEEALATLERGLSLAPDYIDLRLAMARIKTWQGKFEAGSALVEAILAEAPQHMEALNLRGRLAYYQGDLDQAESTFRDVLRQQSDNVQALLGLGDVKAAQGEHAEARDYYRQAAAIDPHSAEIAERLKREPPPVLPWRLDTAASYSTFSREPRKPWRELFQQVSYRASLATTVHGRVELSKRFDQFDSYLQGGVDHRLSKWMSGYVYAGGTPSPDFRERWAVMGGGTVRLWPGKEIVGATVATLDAKEANYLSGDVTTVKPGAQQYFLAGRLWLTGQWINTIDESGNHLQGWLGRIDAQVIDRVHVFGGLAEAPETSENVTLGTSSIFGGLIVDLSQLVSARLDYAREDRERSFVRETLTLSVSLRF